MIKQNYAMEFKTQIISLKKKTANFCEISWLFAKIFENNNNGNIYSIFINLISI